MKVPRDGKIRKKVALNEKILFKATFSTYVTLFARWMNAFLSRYIVMLR